MQQEPARGQFTNRAPDITRRVRWTVVTMLAAAAFFVGTPYFLLAVGHLRRGDWQQLGNEGQAYGGIAAVFGMLALAGVAASLVLQARETAASRVAMQRSFHTDLMMKSLEDPDLLDCWGSTRYDDAKEHKQHDFVNLIMSFWRSMFEVGNMNDHQLRAQCALLFTSGRRFTNARSARAGRGPGVMPV